MKDKKTEAKQREERLAKNLRDNLRRRKTAARKTIPKVKDDTAPESS